MLEGPDLQVGADGSLEIHLSREERPGNWLPMEPDTSMLIVRQNFLDAENEEIAQLRIERVGAPEPPAPLEPASLAGALDSAGRYVEATAQLFADWAEGFAENPNELQPLDPAMTTGAHGSPHFFFYMGYWQLQPDEALIVEATPPECEYWNFQLNNHWMESLDFPVPPDPPPTSTPPATGRTARSVWWWRTGTPASRTGSTRRATRAARWVCAG